MPLTPSLNEFVEASIKSKLIDQAGDFIFYRPDLKTWPEIRNALRIKLGDKTDRHVLMQQLNFLNKNINENSLDFIDRIKTLLSRINIKICVDPNLSLGTKNALIAQTESTAITVLMANVTTELRTILMIHNPKNLDEANTLVFNHSLIEQQINSRVNISRRTLNVPIRPNIPPAFHHNNYSVRQMTPTNSFRMPNMAVQNTVPPQQTFSHRPIFPRQPINIQPRPVNRQFFTNRQVFGNPVNVFSRENSHKPTEKPTPMSTTSRIPSKQRRNFNRNQTNPYRNPHVFATQVTNLDDCNYYENQSYANPERDYYNNYTNNPEDDQYYHAQDNFPDEY